MTHRILPWLALTTLLSAAACGEEETKKSHPNVPAEEAEQDGADVKPGLPLPEQPVSSAQITSLNCADVTPDVVIAMTRIRDYSTVITVSTGGVVQWVNDVDGSHTVTSEEPGGDNVGKRFDLGSLAPGEKACARFDYAGEFDYFCRLHSDQMHDDRVVIVNH